MKRLRKVIIFVILLIIIVVVVGLFSMDGLIREAVQSQGHTALGCKTRLSDASLSIFAGLLGLNGLTVDNPAGYANKRLLTMKSCHVTVSIHSLLGQTVKIKTIAIDGLDVNIDQKGLSNNVQAVLAYINAQEKAAGSGSSARQASGKQLQIDKVVLTNLLVHLHVADVPGVAPSIDIPLKKIEIVQPTNPNGRPLRLVDLIRQVLVQVVSQAMRSGKMPQVVHSALGEMNNVLQGTGSLLQKDTGKLLGGVNSSLQNLFHGNAKTQP